MPTQSLTADYAVAPVSCGPRSRTEVVIYRSSLLFLLSVSVVLTAVVLSDLLPYKYEVFDNITLRIGLWNLCAWFDEKPFEKCFGSYNDMKEEHDWFNALRYLLLVAFSVIFLSYAWALLIILRAKTRPVQSFTLPVIFQLLAGLLLLTAQILYHTFILFDFVEEEVRWQGLSWTEESDIEELNGHGYYLTWGIFFLTLINVVVCFVVGRKDDLFWKRQTNPQPL